MAYIINIKDENDEWVSIPAIKGADGEQGPIGPAGPQGPQGEPGTTHWSDLEDKPFETLGEGLSVDSEGALNVESVPELDWDNVSDKPFSSIGTDLEVTNDTLNISTTVKTQLVNAIEDVSVGLSNLSNEVANKIDDPISKNSGDVLTYDGSEWVAQAGGTTYTAGTGIDITNGVISCTFVDANSEGY